LSIIAKKSANISIDTCDTPMISNATVVNKLSVAADYDSLSSLLLLARIRGTQRKQVGNMFVDLVMPLIGELLRWISLLIFRVLIFVFFNDVEVLGRENIPRTGAVIFVCTTRILLTMHKHPLNLLLRQS